LLLQNGFVVVDALCSFALYDLNVAVMKKIICAVAVVVFGVLTGCKKCEQVTTASGTIYCDSAMVRYHALVIPDICQLSIKTGNTYYLPVTLDNAFLVDSLPVKMCYTFTGDSDFCGFVNVKYAHIDIKAIQRI